MTGLAHHPSGKTLREPGLEAHPPEVPRGHHGGQSLQLRQAQRPDARIRLLLKRIPHSTLISLYNGLHSNVEPIAPDTHDIEPDSEESLDWSNVKPVAKALAKKRVDHSVSFEALADELGVSVDLVKDLILKNVESGADLQLIPGESRQVRDSKSGLDYQGSVYYRFSFLD